MLLLCNAHYNKVEPVSKRGEATKQQILEAAAQLFTEGGFRALRINAICERANVSPTSVYWHFKDKSGLVQTVLESAFEPIAESITSTEADAPQDIAKFLKSLENLVMNQPAGALTMLAYVADNLQDADLESAIQKTRRREAKLQSEVLSSALGVDNDTARQQGVLINACVNYAAIVKLSGGSRRDVKQILNALDSVF